MPMNEGTVQLLHSICIYKLLDNFERIELICALKFDVV
jgi:hypothetical protein